MILTGSLWNATSFLFLLIMIYLFQRPGVSLDLAFDDLVTILLPFSEGLNMKLTAGRSFELSGKKRVEYLGKTVDGIFLASLVKHRRHISFHFFPIYTHPSEFTDVPANLKKALKGRSCFHIRKQDEELKESIRVVLGKGLRLYRDLGLV